MEAIVNIADIATYLALLGYTTNFDGDAVWLEPELGNWMPIVSVKNGTIYLEATTAEDEVMPDLRPADGRPIQTFDDLTQALEHFGQTTLTTL